MRRALVDLNIVLDVLLDREPHVADSAALWAMVERGEAEGLLAAHSLPTLHYLAGRARGPAFADHCVRDVLAVFRIAPVDERVLREAVALEWPDYEDAVCAAAAEQAHCQLIVTRDARGFRGSRLPALEPRGAMAALRLPQRV